MTELQDRIFRIEGQIVDGSDRPVPDLMMAVVDRDLFRDDLIGFGTADRSGRFHLSFTRPAFTQEPLEMERSPDLYLVLSKLTDGEVEVLRHAELVGPTPEQPSVDVGRVVVDPVADRVPGASPLPNVGKRTRRSVVDAATIAYCVAEVAPAVEAATGWKDLAQGVQFRAVDSLAKAYRAHLEAIGVADDGHSERGLDWMMGASGAVALYDPFTRVVSIHRQRAEQQNLDGLKVILGHELVHAGQFREHPELRRRHAEHTLALHEAWAECDRRLDERVNGDDDVTVKELIATKMRGDAGVRRAMTRLETLQLNLEGYAYHVEVDALMERYPLGAGIPRASLSDWIVGSILALLAQTTKGSDGAPLPLASMDPYERGREMYLATRARGIARFDPDLTPGGKERRASAAEKRKREKARAKRKRRRAHRKRGNRNRRRAS